MNSCCSGGSWTRIWVLGQSWSTTSRISSVCRPAGGTVRGRDLSQCAKWGAPNRARGLLWGVHWYEGADQDEPTVGEVFQLLRAIPTDGAEGGLSTGVSQGQPITPVLPHQTHHVEDGTEL